jgi:SAM-dependent methyltransferase
VPEERWGERDARWYDELAAAMFDPAVVDPIVDVLAELAGPGGALELGIGTGRIALPLAERGVRVHGIDVSAAMVARLRAKPGGQDIGVTIGDFATTRVEGSFAVAYMVWNAITNLTTQDEQVACFQNAAGHLGPGGRLVVEVDVPALQRLPAGETVRPFAIGPTRLGFDEYDVVAQGVRSHHFWRTGTTFEASSAPYRYVWPSELDLMARLAGLRLRHRWGGWKQEPFTAESTAHVSVWEAARRPGDPPARASTGAPGG